MKSSPAAEIDGRLVVGRLSVAGILVVLLGLRRSSPIAIVLGGALIGAGLKLLPERGDAGSTPA